MWNLRSIRPLQTMASWHVESHYGSRRNALVASTALAKSRHERMEVEKFLERYLAKRKASRTA